MTAVAPSADPPRRRPHRTWPERLSIAFTFVCAFMCLVVAAALLVGYSVVRSRNIADFENPADAAGDALTPLPTLNATATIATTSSTSATSATSTTSAIAASDATTEAATATPTGAPLASIGDQPTESSPDSSAPPFTAVGVSATASTTATTASPTSTTTSTTSTTSTTTEAGAAPVATFPDADPDALNFLITGADNGACIDPDSPMAAGIGDRESMGERSDTIMIVRVDPSADRVAVLSFPRDLWVEIADSGNMQRINSAYVPGEPQRLADTIYENFGIPINHYIQVDFCAFKTLVDAVGGVSVPFEYPAMDENTGLLVETTGCVNLDGDMALAYVRSRHYQYEDPPGSGNWESDPTSDLGRISRQQDFLRRVLSSLLDKGPLDPSVARGLIRAGTDYIVTDRDLTPAKMMEFAGVMNDVDPASITTYQIEATGRTINGNAVLVPNVDGENMQAVLALFKGETSLADAPIQQFEQTTTAPPRGTSTTAVTDGSAVTDDATDTDDAVTASAAPEPAASEPVVTGPAESTVSSVPSDGPQETQFGIVPPRDVTC